MDEMTLNEKNENNTKVCAILPGGFVLPTLECLDLRRAHSEAFQHWENCLKEE